MEWDAIVAIGEILGIVVSAHENVAEFSIVVKIRVERVQPRLRVQAV